MITSPTFYPTLQNLWFLRLYSKESWPTIVLSCFHTIHLLSYDTTNKQCPIGTQPLLQEMKNLTQSFSQSLLEPTKPSTSAPPINDLNQGTDEDEDPQLNNRYGNINESYQSEALEKNITDTLKSFSVSHSSVTDTTTNTGLPANTGSKTTTKQSFTSPI